MISDLIYVHVRYYKALYQILEDEEDRIDEVFFYGSDDKCFLVGEEIGYSSEEEQIGGKRSENNEEMNYESDGERSDDQEKGVTIMNRWTMRAVDRDMRTMDRIQIMRVKERGMRTMER